MRTCRPILAFCIIPAIFVWFCLVLCAFTFCLPLCRWTNTYGSYMVDPTDSSVLYSTMASYLR